MWSAEGELLDLGYWSYEPKGPCDIVTSTWKPEQLIKGGWISRECGRHLKSIDTFCYCLLGVCFSPLTGFLLHFFFPSMLQHPHNAHRLKCGLGCHSLPQKAFCIDVTCSHEKEGSMFQTVFLSTTYHSSSSNPNKKIHQHLLQMCPDPLKKTWFLCFTRRAVLKWQRDFCSTLKFSIGYNNYATQDK